MGQLGLGAQQAAFGPFPQDDKTRKCNLAEIVLADIGAACDLTLPVYRLRYNPNVEQSMKGDDVLAFDLDANPVRIVVGEAKFRSQSSKTAVTQMVDGLSRSHSAGVPASLQFVVHHLIKSGEQDTAERVLDCARLFALGQLQLDYVGLLLSDTRAADRCDNSTHVMRRLAFISLGMPDPGALVEACCRDLE
jgi:hypothetical protein